ncbi:MAG: hypothetical protein COW61_01240 [Candidatus Yonathbacteria bacterium CG17_big_fil_post_rev_8_21_14_2_50_46_19]|nr:MAG: hypothetical protein COW61_01240 [Candidatus Yonathbacteria bacterium CG17_big_fil_post_rev_8_21_14_2_50_46_19]
MRLFSSNTHDTKYRRGNTALGYNVIAIPVAAGVFAFAGFFLRPEIGALLMSLSTVIVVANALTLRNANLDVV